MASHTKQKKAIKRKKDAKLAQNRVKRVARDQRKEAKLPGIVLVG